MEQRSGRLEGIQVLRLVAAGGVLLQHAVYLSLLPYGEVPALWSGGWFGAAGVYLFFLISGVVIARLVDTNPLQFGLHRLVRIYPPAIYAIALGGIISVSAGASSLSDVRFTSALLLLPTDGSIVEWSHVPYWTLLYEVVFYLVTFVLIVGPRWLFDVGLVIWTLLIFVWNHDPSVPPVVVSTDLVAMVTSPLSLFFIAGACVTRSMRGKLYPLLAVAMIAFGFCYFSPHPGIVPLVLFIAMGLPLVVAGTRLPKRITRSRLVAPLVRGGDWSYGLYLLHAPAIYSAVAILSPTVSPAVTVLVSLILGGVVGVAFGYAEFLFYRRIGRPFADRLAPSRRKKLEGTRDGRIIAQA
jgi:exopolysaccharide production protein ExoZ